MFENFNEEAMGVLSITIGGVSIGAILILTLYVIKAIMTNRKQIALRKDDVVNAFKEAILPKNIKIDVSSKIAKPINEGLDKMNKILEAKVAFLEDGLKLVLKVLNEFTHVKKLPPETQEKIAEYIDIPADVIEL